MAEYKLTYFNIKGLAEPIRFILSYMDAKFEDVRLTREEWLKIKQDTPFGKLPILEVNGKTVSQSIAISRYLGKKAGLCGKNEWEDLMIDIIVDTISDLIQAIAGFRREINEEAKAKKYKELIDEILPLYLQKFDKAAEENGGYLANGKFSWADIYFAAIRDSCEILLEFDITEKYLHLKGLCDKVYKIPQIKSWIAKRPEDVFPKL